MEKKRFLLQGWATALKGMQREVVEANSKLFKIPCNNTLVLVYDKVYKGG
jgi:hypothetical protein